jgi:hypothetical protein
MKTHIFRLNSVGKNTVGGAEAGAINLIYNFLLQEFKQDVYQQIHVNHIIDNLDELIIKEGKKIYINIRYPIDEGFERKTSDERNKIRLAVIHAALLRIAHEDKKLDINKLNEIRKKILNNNFSFDFTLKAFPNKKSKNSLVANLVVHPSESKFDYYVTIKEGPDLRCKIHIYAAGTDTFYVPYFFQNGKWKDGNEFSLTGTMNELTTIIDAATCKSKIINNTPYDNPPYYTSIKFGALEHERQKAYQDWLHSLPPERAAILKDSYN